MTTSFIDSVLTEMTQDKNRNGSLARYVEDMVHDHPANRIYLAYFKLQNERMAFVQRKRETGVAVDEPQLKPEFLLSFVQQVMNRICWAARRLYVAQTNQAEEERGNGIDFTQDLGAQLGVECVGTEHIADVVANDFFVLSQVYSLLAGKMNYLDTINDLRMFQRLEQQDDGTWQVTNATDDFDEAMDVMAEMIVEMQERQQANDLAEAAAINFESPLTAAA